MAAPWEKIRTEYITTGISYRQLAKKYGLNQATIATRAKKEDWVSKRKQMDSETQAKVLEAAAEAKVDRALRLLSVADKLLDRVEEVLDDPRPMNPTGLKSVSEALRNLKETQMIRSEKDLEEQDARIAKMRSDVSRDDGNKTVTVVLGDLERYAK